MIQRPTSVGLLLCEAAVIEEKTRNVTLVNQFTQLQFDAFPSVPRPFTVCSLLTDGLGEANLFLRIVTLDTLEDIYLRSWTMMFRNPLSQVRLLLRVRHCSFPLAGPYQFALEADGDMIAQCVLQVNSPEEQL